MRLFGNKRIFCLIAGILFCKGTIFNANADALGGEFLFFTMHVAKDTILLGHSYKRKLTDDGQFVLTPGIEFYYDKSLYNAVFGFDQLRFTAGAYYDSVNHKSGYLAMLFRWDFRPRQQLNISFGLGPTLIFRETWNTIPEYKDDGYYNESDNFLPGYQYKWIIGGDLDLQWPLTNNKQLVVSIIPGIPFVIATSVGLRWILD